jgi:polysaccharide export outer membrane protein
MATPTPFRLLFLAAVLVGMIAGRASAAPTEQDFRKDLSYYKKITQQQKMDANNRLYILNRLRAKYKESEFDLTDLYAEIDHWSGVRQKQSASAAAPEPGAPAEKKETPAAPQRSKTARLIKAAVAEKKDSSELSLKVPGLSRYKDTVIHDPKGLQPPVVIVFLYGTRDALKPAVRNFRVKNGLIRQVRTRTISNNPPTLKVSASLRENKPVRVFQDGDRLVVSVQRSESASGTGIPLGASAPTVLSPDQAGAFEQAPPEGFSDDGSVAAAPSSAAVLAASALAPNSPAPAEATDPGTAGIIDVGDLLDIRIEPGQEFSRQAAVRPDGNITLPIGGIFEASGLGKDPLQDDIQSRLSEYLPQAKVTVAVIPYDPRKVAAAGEIVNPGLYEPGATCSSLLARAGGFRPEADRKRVSIYRNVRGTAEKIVFDAAAFAKSPNPAQDPVLQPGDVIEVPAVMSFIYVSGEVKNQGRYEFRPGMKTLQGIYQAGGFTDQARMEQVRVIREEQGKKMVQEINLKELLDKHPELDLPLKEGDLILVPKREAASGGKKWLNRGTVSWVSFFATLGVVLALLV